MPCYVQEQPREEWGRNLGYFAAAWDISRSTGRSLTKGHQTGIRLSCGYHRVLLEGFISLFTRRFFLPIAERPINAIRSTSPAEHLSGFAWCEWGRVAPWLLLGPDLMQCSPSLVSEAGGGCWDSFLYHSGFFLFSNWYLPVLAWMTGIPCHSTRKPLKAFLGSNSVPLPLPSWPPGLHPPPTP